MLHDKHLQARPELKAAFVRDLIRQRRRRDRLFPAGLFGEPAWDMLLDLAAARLEGTDVTVSSLALAAVVPTSTAQRYIKVLLASELITRHDDPTDGRCTRLRLTSAGWMKMKTYLESLSA